jgi:hypothetical protein
MRIFQTTISDLVQISPEDFQKLSAVAIEDNINEKYANKVSCLKLILTAKTDPTVTGYPKCGIVYGILRSPRLV